MYCEKLSSKANLFLSLKGICWTSLVVQRLRIHLPMQGTWVQPLVGELRAHMPQDT